MKARVRPSAYCTRRRISVLVVGNSVVAQRLARRVGARQLQHGDHLPRFGARADQRGIAAPASASASASSRMDLPAPVSPVSAVRPVVEHQIELVDQDDVANRKRAEHPHPRQGAARHLERASAN
jgi:hypothetical protein